MTILFIIAMTITAMALLAALFTDVHPNVFYSAVIFAFGLQAVADAWRGRWWWEFAFDAALLAAMATAWRKEILARRRKAARA